MFTLRGSVSHWFRPRPPPPIVTEIVTENTVKAVAVRGVPRWDDRFSVRYQGELLGLWDPQNRVIYLLRLSKITPIDQS